MDRGACWATVHLTRVRQQLRTQHRLPLHSPLIWLLKTKQQSKPTNKQTKKESSKCWEECEEIGNFVHCWWESKSAASVENDAKIEFKKLK